MDNKKFIVLATFEGFGKDLDRVLFFEAFKSLMFEYTTEEARDAALAKMRIRAKKKGITVKFKCVTRAEQEQTCEAVDASTAENNPA